MPNKSPRPKPAILIAMIAGLLVVGLVAWFVQNAMNGPFALEDGKTGIPIIFSGGHETDSVDRGRPVVLIAAALGVKPEVFREAFSHVRPAPAGSHPDREQVMANKTALMNALEPYGVTNDRLDTVSNYYRYNRSRGELWPARSASAYAIVQDGVITSFKVTKGGSGYSSPPTVNVPGFEDVETRVQLSFGQEFESNGSVTAITIQAR